MARQGGIELKKQALIFINLLHRISISLKQSLYTLSNFLRTAYQINTTKDQQGSHHLHPG